MKVKRLKKPNKQTLAVVMTVAVMLLLIQLALPVSAAEQTVTQAIKVKQTVEGKPEKTSYVYVIIQTSGSDITSGIKDRTFTLSGTDEFETQMTFSAPGTYEFTVGRLKDESKKASEATLDDLYKDDSVVPVKHPFGYKVTENEDGSLSVLPYTCYDNHVEFLKDGTGIVLSNIIKGPAETTPTPTPSSTVTPTPSSTVTPTPSSTVTPTLTPTPTPKPTSNSDNGKGQYTPKTGDEFHMVLWASIAGVSVLIIILLLIIGRKKKKKES